MTQLDILNQKQITSNGDKSNSEISIADIISFLRSTWRQLVLAAMTGAILGLIGWYFAGKYQAELVLDNKGGITLLSWRALQKNLPNLADQMIDEGKVSAINLSIYGQMSDMDWWVRNVVPNYAITKADSKEFPSAESLSSERTKILSLTVTTKALSREQAIDRGRVAADFLLRGSAYLEIKNLINAKQAELIAADTDLTKKINDTQIELRYQAKRLADLEVLLKRFPNDQRLSSQVVDPKDSGAKYLPISTQIIAVNTEINANREKLERLNDSALQLVILKAFLVKAAPLMQANYDGLDLTQKLLDLQGELYDQTRTDDIKSRAYLEGLRLELLANQARFTKGLVEITAPKAAKKGAFTTSLGGLFSGFFFMLLVLQGKRIWMSKENCVAESGT